MAEFIEMICCAQARRAGADDDDFHVFTRSKKLSLDVFGIYRLILQVKFENIYALPDA